MRARAALVLAVILIGLGGPAVAADGAGSTPVGRVCVSYLDRESFDSQSSQNFESTWDQYDSTAADDFSVTRRCRARAATVVGWYYGGVGPAASETVTFYRDQGGQPGRVLSSQTVVGADWQGEFEITLDRSVRLRPGRTYWFSAQINMDFTCCGTWGWLMRDIEGSPGLWRNPGDGFKTGCIEWTPMAECRPDLEGGDFVFEVRTR